MKKCPRGHTMSYGDEKRKQCSYCESIDADARRNIDPPSTNFFQDIVSSAVDDILGSGPPSFDPPPSSSDDTFGGGGGFSGGGGGSDW